MPGDFSDDQVAAILSKEAKDSSIKYSSLGMSAFLPSKPPANKLKPNTRFLRNLVRETDSHNAALLAKEAADSRARLEQLVTKDTRSANDIRRRQLGNITALLNGNATKRRKVDDQDQPVRKRRDSSSSDGDTRRRSKGHDERRDKDRRGDKSRRDKDTRDPTSRDRKERGHRSESGRLSRQDQHGSRHHSRSRSPREGKARDSKRRDRSPARKSRRSLIDPRDVEISTRSPRRKRSPASDSGSDPLEAIVGPLPPPKVKSRGRGTVSSSSGIDTRFSDNYDPALDLAAGDQEGDGDDWELVLDRVKWRQQGADRLRAAGFTEDEVQGWESGKKAEVKWAKSGEGREWDRGKSVEGDGGDVEWGRLKGR